MPDSEAPRATRVQQRVATQAQPRMHTSRLSRPTTWMGTMALRACPRQQANCTLIARMGSWVVVERKAPSMLRGVSWVSRGAGDGNRTRTTSLGIRQVGGSDRPDLGIRCTVSDRHRPLTPGLMARQWSMADGSGGWWLNRQAQLPYLMPPCSLALPESSSATWTLRLGRRQ